MPVVVPENIHAPTTEGIGNAKGVGSSRSKAQILERRGVISGDGQVQCSAN